MLSCHIDIERTSDEVFDCKDCDKCLPISKFNYPFDKDLKNSNDLVKKLKDYIEANTMLQCFDPEIHKNPDIRAVDISLNNFLVCRIEAKYLEGKAFVKASNNVGLRAKEALVVDESKLLHYIECKKNDYKKYNREVPLFVVWKFDRPCDDIGGITIYQEIDNLEKIYKEKPERSFERKKPDTDYENGVKKGITGKYHYSIKETKPFWQLLPEIFEIAKKNNIWETPPKTEAPSQTEAPSEVIKNICKSCNQPYTPKFKGAPLCLTCYRSGKR